MRPDALETGGLQKLLLLKTLPELEGLDDGAARVVAARAREAWFEPGQVLIEQGEAFTRTFILSEGEVRIESEGAVIGRVGRKGSIGFLGMLAGFQARRRVVAERATRALVLDQDALSEITEESFSLHEHLLQALAERGIQTYLELDQDFTAPSRPTPRPVWLPQDRELDLVERILAIRRVHAFEHSSIESVARYAGLLQPVTWEPGQVLWEEGGVQQAYLQLVEGEVVCTRAEGRSVMRFGPPSLPGLFGVVSGRPTHWYTCRAETRVRGLRVEYEVLLDLLEDDSTLAANFVALMARRIIHFLEAKARR